jgi:hypothetical protein
MWSVLRFEESRNPVSQQDVEVMVGVIATVSGGVLGGDLGADMVEKFAERFVNAGLLDPEPTAWCGVWRSSVRRPR